MLEIKIKNEKRNELLKNFTKFQFPQKTINSKLRKSNQ